MWGGGGRGWGGAGIAISGGVLHHIMLSVLLGIHHLMDGGLKGGEERMCSLVRISGRVDPQTRQGVCVRAHGQVCVPLFARRKLGQSERKGVLLRCADCRPLNRGAVQGSPRPPIRQDGWCMTMLQAQKAGRFLVHVPQSTASCLMLIHENDLIPCAQSPKP